MDIIIGFVVFAAAVVAALLCNITLVAALAVGFGIFYYIAYRRGFSGRELIAMSLQGGKDASIVIEVMMLLGFVTASWRAAGTISIFVYYGIKIITPTLFLVIAFLLTSILSYAMGTSFGVAGTVGVIFMALARGGGVDPCVTAGVIMSGVLFGDRSSPVSSMVQLIATITHTEVYANVKNVARSGAVPYVVCLLIYGVLSVRNPIGAVDTELMTAMENSFHLSWVTVLPAAIMLILPLLRVNILISLTVSWISGIVIAIAVQGQGLLQLLRISVLGYTCENPVLANTLNGGGFVSMLEVCGIIIFACMYAGIVNGTNLLQNLQGFIDRLSSRIGEFPVLILVGMVAGAIFCNQIIAVLMATTFMKDNYAKRGISSEEMVVDICDSVHIMPALIPWNILISVPLSFMGVGIGAIPYACYVYIIPLHRFVIKIISKHKK